MNRHIPILIITLLAVLAVVYYVSYPKQVIDTQNTNLTDIEDTTEIITEYGFPVDSFEIIRGKIRRNEPLGQLLLQMNVSAQLVNELDQFPRDSFNIRGIRAGNKYTAFCTKDSSREVCYFVYEHTPVEYFVLSFDDSLRVEKQFKEVRRVKKTASDTIDQSLWVTIKKGGANPYLSIRLSEIYAWVIDFFMLDDNDHFTIIYEEEYVDSVSVGIGQVYAAHFNHLGHDYYAIPFTQDGQEQFFDKDGNSLRRQFLKAPLRFSRVSSRFSHSRLHPVLRIRRPHHGVDYAAPTGTPVHAVGDGIITTAAYHKGNGNYIKIRHNSVYRTAYLHLNGFGKGIKKGVRVKQGQVIGYVGSTGLSTGPHLDFRFWKNGRAIDPLKVEAPPVEPIHQDNKQAFDSVKLYWIEKIEDSKQEKETDSLPIAKKE